MKINEIVYDERFSSIEFMYYLLDVMYKNNEYGFVMDDLKYFIYVNKDNKDFSQILHDFRFNNTNKSIDCIEFDKAIYYCELASILSIEENKIAFLNSESKFDLNQINHTYMKIVYEFYNKFIESYKVERGVIR